MFLVSAFSPLGGGHNQAQELSQLSYMSVLRKATPQMIRWEPYPHIVIDNALDPQLYAGKHLHTPGDVHKYTLGKVWSGRQPACM